MKRELSEGERKDIIFTVEEQKKEKYWRYIRNHLLNILEQENKILDQYKLGTMKTDDIKDWNIIQCRIATIKRMLNINEEIIMKHTNFLEQLKHKIEAIGEKVVSFLGVKVTHKE